MLLKVLKRRKETNNSFSLILEKPKNFHFYPGQYLDIELPVQDPNGNTRAFTISSSPTENYLMVTPKVGISEYKKFMENLKKGDTIKTSHPAGTFTLDESTPAVFIAGGVGITPFRSMLKYVFDSNLNTKITLIYSNSDEDFLFKEDLNGWQNNLPNAGVVYYQTNKKGHLDITKLDAAVQGNVTKDIFYLAGPPKMVDDFAKMLIDLGVDEINIRYDRFDGY